MSYQQNYYGKNIVVDPAYTFKRVSWGKLGRRLALPVGASYLWSLISAVASALVSLLIGFILAATVMGLLGSLGSLLANPSSAAASKALSGLGVFGIIMLLLGFVLASFVAILIEMLSGYGLANLALRYKRDREAGLGDAFGAFANFGRVFVVAALQYLLVVAWSLIPYAGLPLSVVASYRYRFAYYVLIDDPQMSGLEAIRESKRLMYGNKGQMFVQDATFLGWAGGFWGLSYLLFGLFSLIPVVGPVIAAALIAICSVAFSGVWGMYREIAAAAFYDQARSGSTTRDAVNMSRDRVSGLRQGDSRPSITALSGSYQGATFRFEPDEEVVIGRDSSLSDIILSEGAEKISRKHLSVRYDSRDQVYVVVDYSSNGTFTDEGRQLVANTENRLPRGTVLVVGSRSNTIRLD